jgi:hypothetical protein
VEEDFSFKPLCEEEEEAQQACPAAALFMLPRSAIALT